jgi:hypothetical protein
MRRSGGASPHHNTANVIQPLGLGDGSGVGSTPDSRRGAYTPIRLRSRPSPVWRWGRRTLGRCDFLHATAGALARERRGESPGWGTSSRRTSR